MACPDCNTVYVPCPSCASKRQTVMISVELRDIFHTGQCPKCGYQLDEICPAHGMEDYEDYVRLMPHIKKQMWYLPSYANEQDIWYQVRDTGLRYRIELALNMQQLKEEIINSFIESSIGDVTMYLLKKLANKLELASTFWMRKWKGKCLEWEPFYGFWVPSKYIVPISIMFYLGVVAGFVWFANWLIH